MKLIYGALNEKAAKEKLIDFKEKWQSQYPSAVKSWEDNWDILSTFFAQTKAENKRYDNPGIVKICAVKKYPKF